MDKFNHRVHTVPNVHQEVLSEPNQDVYFIGSDGVFDILTDDNIIAACKEVNSKDKTSEEYLKSIISKGYDAARDNNWRFNRGLGTWDDQSCWCVTITTGNILGSDMIKEKIGKHSKIQQNIAKL